MARWSIRIQDGRRIQILKEENSNLGGGGTPAPEARGTTGKDSSRSSLRLPSSSSRAENFSKPCHKSRGILNKYPPGKHFLKPKLNFNYIRSVFACSFSGTASSKRESWSAKKESALQAEEHKVETIFKAGSGSQGYMPTTTSPFSKHRFNELLPGYYFVFCDTFTLQYHLSGWDGRSRSLDWILDFVKSSAVSR